jgi:hypothetical protein
MYAKNNTGIMYNGRDQMMYYFTIGAPEILTDSIQTTAWHPPSRILPKYGLNEAIRYFTCRISNT